MEQTKSKTKGSRYEFMNIRARRRIADVGVPECQRKIYCIGTEEGYGSSLSNWEIVARTFYRLIEIPVSLIALIVSLPVMLVIAVVIKLDSPGPVLFFQRRVGRSRRVSAKDLVIKTHLQIVDPHFSYQKKYWVPTTFWFVKFRTMYVDAKERFPQLYDYNFTKEEIDTIPFKVQDDPRITRVGRWLRASTLDELPNFWNVLIGDMRLVGPRPEITEMLPNYLPDQMRKFTVKPGVTGLPQINGRGRLTFQRTVAYDQEYVEKKSVLLDIKIIIKTIWKVLIRHGAF